MDNKQSKKAIIVMVGQDHCLVIEEGSYENPTFRLPKVDELSSSIAVEEDRKELGENAVLVYIKEEVGPWDLLDPFPPANYLDYSHMSLTETPEDEDWKHLNEEDRNLLRSLNIN